MGTVTHQSVRALHHSLRVVWKLQSIQEEVRLDHRQRDKLIPGLSLIQQLPLGLIRVVHKDHVLWVCQKEELIKGVGEG